MRSYWSCSKFADWLRGTPKPGSETSKGWREWEEEAKKAHPFRYWLADDVLNFFEDIVYFIPDKIHDIKCYIRNRYITKTHALTSNLKCGKWYELDDRILNCLFDELVNFVEIDKAQMNWDYFEKNNLKYKIPCAAAGLNYLAWETTLKNDDEWTKMHKPEEFNQPSNQAIIALETLKLYEWWKEIRPNRLDPEEASGRNDYNEFLKKKYGKEYWEFDSDESYTEEEKTESKRLLDIDLKIEDKYNQEDTDMLILLIKNRSNYWT